MSENRINEELLSEIFKCAMCGYCCHGETTVSLDEHDQERMVRCLGGDREQAQDRYWRVTGSRVQMKVEDGHCIFFDSAVGCKVHEGRPWRCRQWPLHPSILSDRNNFETIRSSCPGINKDVGYDRFCELLKVILDESDQLKTAP